MAVRVLFFGATADLAGKRNVELQVADGFTAHEALATIVRQIPGLASHKLLISLNQEYASGEEIVRDNDELAIFTAVSGG